MTTKELWDRKLRIDHRLMELALKTDSGPLDDCDQREEKELLKELKDIENKLNLKSTY